MLDLNKIIWSGLFLCLTGCAAITSPEGGPKDEEMPKIQSYEPANLSKNVSTQNITLQFDEPIQVQDLQKQLLITPDADNSYKYKINKNELTLQFEKPFEPNTTYSLQFREGIKDITEGNKAENLNLIFSTGSYLDSAKVRGEVINLLSNKPETNFTVGLYPVTDTGTVKTTKPYYVTKTNEAGNFSFNYVKEGEYSIYAFDDVNTNLKYNQNTERIAYLPKPITVSGKTDTIKLKTVQIDTKKPFVSKKETFRNLNRITFNEGIQQIKFLKDSLPYSISDNGVMVEFYSKSSTSIVMPISFIDSASNENIDTLQLKFTGLKAPQVMRGFLVDNNQSTISKNESVKLKFEIPITINGATPIKVIEDTTSSYYLKYPEQIVVDKTGKLISFKPVTTAKKLIEIELDSTLIKPINNDTLSFPRLQLSVTNNQNTGSLSGTVDTGYKNYQIQIINESNKIIQELASVEKFSLKNLWPGNYRIRVLIDENNNGKWEGGDPELKRPAEKIYFYPTLITIRANWEVEDILLKF